MCEEKFRKETARKEAEEERGEFIAKN